MPDETKVGDKKGPFDSTEWRADAAHLKELRANAQERVAAMLGLSSEDPKIAAASLAGLKYLEAYQPSDPVAFNKEMAEAIINYHAAKPLKMEWKNSDLFIARFQMGQDAGKQIWNETQNADFMAAFMKRAEETGSLEKQNFTAPLPSTIEVKPKGVGDALRKLAQRAFKPRG